MDRTYQVNLGSRVSLDLHDERACPEETAQGWQFAVATGDAVNGGSDDCRVTSLRYSELPMGHARLDGAVGTSAPAGYYSAGVATEGLESSIAGCKGGLAGSLLVKHGYANLDDALSSGKSEAVLWAFYFVPADRSAAECSALNFQPGCLDVYDVTLSPK